MTIPNKLLNTNQEEEEIVGDQGKDRHSEA
jgi:hypothetical protein